MGKPSLSRLSLSLHTRVLLLATTLAAASCSGEEPPAGSPGDGGARDAGESDGEVTECSEEGGRSAATVIGPAGGTITFCGASLRVPEGALDSERTFTLVRSAATVAPPFEHVVAGSAIRFEPEDTFFAKHAAISVPVNGSEGGYLHAYFRDPGTGAWTGIEHCTSHTDTLEIHFLRLGTFVAVQDTEVFPNSPGGSGAASATVGGQEMIFSFGPPGYAIFTPTEDGRFVDLVGRDHSGGENEYRRLRFMLWFDANGALEFTRVELTLTDGADARFYVNDSDTESSLFELSQQSDAGLISASFSGELDGNNGTITLGSGQLSATVEKYRWPPEGACSAELMEP
jgi:hypothetical protein